MKSKKLEIDLTKTWNTEITYVCPEDGKLKTTLINKHNTKCAIFEDGLFSYVLPIDCKINTTLGLKKIKDIINSDTVKNIKLLDYHNKQRSFTLKELKVINIGIPDVPSWIENRLIVVK